MENSTPADPDPMGKVIEQLKTDIDRLSAEFRDMHAVPNSLYVAHMTPVVWRGDTPPANPHVGDIWYDTSHTPERGDLGPDSKVDWPPYSYRQKYRQPYIPLPSSPAVAAMGPVEKWWDTNTQQWIDHPPIAATVNNNINGTNGSSGHYNTLPPLSINIPPPQTWTYNYGPPSPALSFICPRCGQSKSMNDSREYVAKDGTSKNACIDCIEGTSTPSGSKALANANLQVLLERAAAYVQICHEGGDWMLVDKQPELSRDLLESIRYSLSKDGKWDPSQLRREGKI